MIVMIVVSALLWILLAGCSTGPDCDEPSGIPILADLSVPEDMFESAAGSDGELSEAECVDLCRACFCGAIEEVHGCTSFATGTSIPPSRVIQCDLTGGPACDLECGTTGSACE